MRIATSLHFGVLAVAVTVWAGTSSEPIREVIESDELDVIP